MTKYREILRLSSLGFGNRNIALSGHWKTIKRMKFLKAYFIQSNATALKSVCQTTTISTKNCSALR